jgi:hypothetical protein
MLQVQDAVKRSLSTFAELFSDLKLEELRLEEVSLTPDESSWLVTVSYMNPDYEDQLENVPSTSGLQALMGTYRQLHRRLQKTIKIRADNGELVGIKAQWEN